VPTTSSLVTGTSCASVQKVDHGKMCTAVCADNSVAKGNISCLYGALSGRSTCISTSFEGTSVSVEQCTGVLGAGFATNPSNVVLNKAMCGAILGDKNCDYVLEASAALTLGRRLISSRRLAVQQYAISYAVAVPPGTNLDDILSATKSFSDPNSAAAKAFLSSLAAQGVPASGLTVLVAPTVSIGVMIRDKEGNLLTPPPLTTTTTTLTTTTSTTNGTTTTASTSTAAAGAVINDAADRSDGVLVGVVAGISISIFCICCSVALFCNRALRRRLGCQRGAGCHADDALHEAAAHEAAIDVARLEEMMNSARQIVDIDVYIGDSLDLDAINLQEVSQEGAGPPLSPRGQDRPDREYADCPI